MGRQMLLLLIALCGGQSSRPERPSCRSCDRRLSCDCSREGFTHVPIVTGRALALDLSFNNITVVTGDDLAGHEQLRALSLHGNRVSGIHPAAFRPLWSLEDLDLSNNQLTSLNPEWFRQLGALLRLNLLHNPYRCVGPTPAFRGLVRLRALAFGGPALAEIKMAALSGVTELETLTVHANNLSRYESGALAYVWPLGRVALSLRGPFLTDVALASAVLRDVSYPETPIVLEDLHLVGNASVQPIREVARRRVRNVTFRNLSISDEATVGVIEMFDRGPLTAFSLDGVTLTGEGRWEKASWADISSIDQFFVRNLVVLDPFTFVSFLKLRFLLQFPRAVSVVNSQVFVIPCATTGLLENLQFLDLSDNLLTDMTLVETLCGGNGTLKDLRVLNISGNALKVLDLMWYVASPSQCEPELQLCPSLLQCLSKLSRLVVKLHKLTHLDISRTRYSSMPGGCSWPSTLRHLNISGAKLTATTPCLPASLEVLDLSSNDLQGFTVALPALRELHLSGNKLLTLPPGGWFPNLQTLTIQSNTLSMFSRSDLRAYGRLQSLQAGRNKFLCTCEFVAFFQSSVRGDEAVRLTDGVESYACDSPFYLQGEPVGGVHLSVVACHRVLFVFLSCGVALFVGSLVCVLLWRLHVLWYLRMMWAWLRAKHSPRRRLRDGDESQPLLSFDAFVSYSEKDASWVESFLVPELEQPREPSGESRAAPRPLSLCLHKRDFLPGHWIMDNIMSAIERSRRTVFVLSQNFVQSDWCRYELDFSHFWLFEGDAGGRPAILILLEPLSRDDVPKRFCKLRKLVSSTTYLEWPQEEERRAEFWRSLRDAVTGAE